MLCVVVLCGAGIKKAWVVTREQGRGGEGGGGGGGPGIQKAPTKKRPGFVKPARARAASPPIRTLINRFTQQVNPPKNRAATKCVWRDWVGGLALSFCQRHCPRAPRRERGALLHKAQKQNKFSEKQEFLEMRRARVCMCACVC